MIVLFSIEELGGGGKERRLMELLKGLSNFSDFQLHLVLTKKNNDYVDFAGIPVEIHYLQGFSNVSIIFQYYNLIRKLKPNVIHTWSIKTSFYMSVLKPFLNFSLIVGFISDTFGFSHLLSIATQRIIFSSADFIVSNSKSGLVAYQVPEIKGRVIYNGFDLNRISTCEHNKLEALGVKSEIKVVMLANVTQNKNYRLFLEIAKYFVSRYENVSFISIGKILPEYMDMVSSYVENQHPQIHFLGFRSDVSDLIKDCDIGLLCTYSEGISNAIIELMANGIPVITNDMTGGSSELITHGLDGIICEDNYIVNNLEKLIINEEARFALAKNCKSKIQTSFTIESMIDSYVHLYSRCLV